MLLKSCATPPASCPMASIFCEWRSWSSRFFPFRNVAGHTDQSGNVAVSIMKRRLDRFQNHLFSVRQRIGQFIGERRISGYQLPVAAAEALCQNRIRNKVLFGVTNDLVFGSADEKFGKSLVASQIGAFHVFVKDVIGDGIQQGLQELFPIVEL